MHGVVHLIHFSVPIVHSYSLGWHMVRDTFRLHAGWKNSRLLKKIQNSDVKASKIVDQLLDDNTAAAKRVRKDGCAFRLEFLVGMPSTDADLVELVELLLDGTQGPTSKLMFYVMPATLAGDFLFEGRCHVLRQLAGILGGGQSGRLRPRDLDHARFFLSLFELMTTGSLDKTSASYALIMKAAGNVLLSNFRGQCQCIPIVDRSLLANDTFFAPSIATGVLSYDGQTLDAVPMGPLFPRMTTRGLRSTKAIDRRLHKVSCFLFVAGVFYWRS